MSPKTYVTNKQARRRRIHVLIDDEAANSASSKAHSRRLSKVQLTDRNCSDLGPKSINCDIPWCLRELLRVSCPIFGLRSLLRLSSTHSMCSASVESKCTERQLLRLQLYSHGIYLDYMPRASPVDSSHDHGRYGFFFFGGGGDDLETAPTFAQLLSLPLG